MMQIIKPGPRPGVTRLGFAAALLVLGLPISAPGPSTAEAEALAPAPPNSESSFESKQTGEADALIQYVETALVDRSRPSQGRGRGGASRTGPCAIASAEPELMALVPVVTQPVSDDAPAAESADDGSLGLLATQESVLSLTTNAHPTLWFYVPYELSQALTLSLVVQNDRGETLYQEDYTPTANGSGIVRIPFSQDFSLGIGERYHWYLNVTCGAEFLTYVEGWIERVSPPPELQNHLADAPRREQARLYAANGIWQDALTLVAESYRQSPQNSQAQADWVSLLSSIQFDATDDTAVFAAPLLDCCASTIVDE